MMTPATKMMNIMLASAISVICFTSLVGAANVTSSLNVSVQLDEKVNTNQRRSTPTSPAAKGYGNITVEAPTSDALDLHDRGIRKKKKTLYIPRNWNPDAPDRHFPYYPSHDRNDSLDEIMDIDYAMKMGFKAQNEYCNRYCNGNRLVYGKQNSCMTFKCGKCSCDKACKRYRDCCPSQGDDDAPDIARNDFHGCLEVMLGFERVSLTTISSCPEASTTELNRFEDCSHCGNETRSVGYSLLSTGDTKPDLNRCLCGHESSPAVSLDTQAVYCSTECGLCNRETNLMSLPHTTCLDTGETVFIWNHRDNKDLSYPRRSCDKKTMNITQHIDTCNSNVTSSHAHGEEMTALCQQYNYPVYAGGASYRNIFCALCNGLRLYRSGCSANWVTSEPMSLSPPFIVDETGLTDVITSLRPLYTYSTVGPRQCLDDQWYDTALDMCRNITCQEKRARVPGQLYCEDPNVANSSLLLYTLSPYFTVVTNVSRVPCLRDWSPVRDDVVSHLAQTIQNLNVNSYKHHVSNFETKNGLFNAFAEFIVPTSMNQTEFELKIVEAFFPSELFFTILGDSMIELRSHTHSVLNGYCCDASYANPFSWKSQLSYNLPYGTTSTTITFSPLVPFTKVLLNGTEYQCGDDSLLLTYVNVTLPKWQTESGTDGCYVPIAYLQQAYEAAGLFPEPLRRVKMALPSDPVRHILSVCCLVVSIVSLIFLLVTYSTFSQLRSLPGLNNMWLATWLLLAQLLLLIVPRLTEVDGCHVLGMVLHYAWLCVISWSCVCSVHMFRVFVTQQDQMHAPHCDSWYLKRYIALSHVIPAVIVGLVVSCTLVLTKSQDTGYGGHVCYLNTVVLRGVAFVLPLALSVIMNIVLLALTACTLSKTHQEQNLGRQSEPSYIRIYAKLSSLTGFCWFFAIIAEVPGCEWMLYLSTVLNGLQGVHLTVSYAVNKRVLKLWKEKILGKGKKSEKRSSESSGPLTIRQTESTHCSNV